MQLVSFPDPLRPLHPNDHSLESMSWHVSSSQAFCPLQSVPPLTATFPAEPRSEADWWDWKQTIARKTVLVPFQIYSGPSIWSSYHGTSEDVPVRGLATTLRSVEIMHWGMLTCYALAHTAFHEVKCSVTRLYYSEATQTNFYRR